MRGTQQLLRIGLQLIRQANNEDEEIISDDFEREVRILVKKELCRQISTIFKDFIIFSNRDAKNLINKFLLKQFDDFIDTASEEFDPSDDLKEYALNKNIYLYNDLFYKLQDIYLSILDETLNIRSSGPTIKNETIHFIAFIENKLYMLKQLLPKLNNIREEVEKKKEEIAQNMKIDWRPTETMPEDYYAL